MLSRPGRWLVLLRAVLVVVGAIAVALTNFPPSYTPWAWAVVGFFAAVTVFSGVLSAVELDPVARVRARILLLTLDSAAAIGFIAVFSFEAGEPWRALYLIPVAAAALRFGLVGGAVAGAVMVGATIVIDALGPGMQWRTAFARIFVAMLAGLVIGRLRDTLNAERSRAEARAAEAERLRDELGHRVDVLETANRCARALGSSLEVDEAFGAFIRELRGLVPFERTAIVLVEGNTATTMATAGRGANEVFPPGNSDPIEGSLLERVLEGKIVVRRDLDERDSPADEQLLALGLRSELVTPLLLGARTIGMLSLSRDRSRRVQRGRGRARLAARTPRRDRGAEHPRLRGRAQACGGARPAFGAPCRLRLARLPRAAQPDGGGDRGGTDAAGSLADALRAAA